MNPQDQDHMQKGVNCGITSTVNLQTGHLHNYIHRIIAPPPPPNFFFATFFLKLPQYRKLNFEGEAPPPHLLSVGKETKLTIQNRSFRYHTLFFHGDSVDLSLKCFKDFGYTSLPHPTFKKDTTCLIHIFSKYKT